MYTSFFGFRAKPFNNKPELRFHYITPAYAENFNTIRRDIREHQEVLVLTGEPGIGKTLFLQRLVTASQNQDVHFISCPYSTLTFVELVDYVCDELGLTIEHMSLPEKIQWLQASLIENLQQGKTIVLVIDDAHNVSDETLSELLSFSTAQKNEEQFLQIFLIGLPELEEKLHATMSAPSAHKVAYYRLWPLESSEVPKFIAQQLRAAGYQGNTIFTPSAVERIAEYTKGSLRALSLLCDASLVIAYMQSSRQVTADIVDEAAQQHCLAPQSQLEETVTRDRVRDNTTTSAPSTQTQSEAKVTAKKPKTGQKLFPISEAQPTLNASTASEPRPSSLPVGSSKSESSSLRRNLPVAAGLVALVLYGVVTAMQYLNERSAGGVKPLGEFFNPPDALVATTPADPAQPPDTINENQPAEPPPSPEVLALLEKAQQQIDEQNMFAPVDDNAFDTYQEILALDPDNKAAKAGLAILNQYSVQPVANEEEKQEQYDLQVEYAKKILKEFDEQFAVAKQEKEAYLKDLSNYYIGQAIMANQKRLSYRLETVLLANSEGPTGAMGGIVSNETLADILNENPPPAIGSLTNNPRADEIVDRHLIRARILMQSGNLLPPGDNALIQFKAVLKLDPGNAEALAGIETIIDHTLNKAAGALASGQLSQAQRLLSKAVEIDPDHAELTKKARIIRRDIEREIAALNSSSPVNECLENSGITKPELIDSMLQNAQQGNASEVSRLISAGVNPGVMDGHTDTALMLAAQNGHTEVMKILLERGAKIDCTNSLGETALMYAVRNGHADAVSLLLTQRASLHFKTKEEADGRTALFMAVERGDFAISRLLLQHGSQSNVKDSQGKTPLMIAAGLGYEPIVKLLLNQNVNLNAQDIEGRTALMLAARNGRVDVLRELLENGAEIHIEDSGGNNALSHAMAGGHLQAAQLLQRAASASAGDIYLHTRKMKV